MNTHVPGARAALLHILLILAFSCTLSEQALAGECPNGTCKSRSGQNNSVKNKTRQLPANEVPEAFSGFRHPLDTVRYSTNRSGNGFGQRDDVSYVRSCGKGNVYHPGVDLNDKIQRDGNDDCGLLVSSIADGTVVWIGGSTDWQGIMVQHRYKGEMVVAAYGHVVAINPKLHVGSFVGKGQYIAKVGSVGTGLCHLHLEIRKVGSHPDLMKGNFFCDYRGGRSIRERQAVSDWYHDPESFINNHPAYNTRPSISLSVPSNSVRRSGFGNYEFTVGVRETGGSTVNIDRVYLDGKRYTGRDFFDTSTLRPKGSLSRRHHIRRFLARNETIYYEIWVRNPVDGGWFTWRKSVTLHRSLF